MPEQKHAVKLTVVFASTDVKSSEDDAAKFAIELEKLLDKFKTKPKSRIASQKLSVEGHAYAELKSKGGK